MSQKCYKLTVQLYCTYQLLQKKHSIATATQLWSLKLFISETSLLHMLYFMNSLTYIYLYVCILYTSSGYRTYIYIHTKGVPFSIDEAAPHHSLQDWFWGVHGSCVECHLLFLLVSPIVSCSVIIKLILGCLWSLVFVLNNIAFCNLLPPRMFMSLDLLSEYRIQHGTIGSL